VKPAITAPELGRPARGLGPRLRSLVGMRSVFVVAGVRYREITAERLRHALSKQGPGSKDYKASFPGGRSMVISCTPVRGFADITGPRLLPVLERIEPVLRPGMRVLIVEGGTGYIAEWVAARVAPSGAVVSLDRDHQSTLYAQRRYRIANTAFEHAGVDALAGETDHAFSGVIALEALRENDEPGPFLSELWRVVAPEGWLVVACPAEPWPPLRVRDPLPPKAMANDELRQAVMAALLPTAAPGGEAEPRPRESSPPAVSILGDGKDGWSIVAAVKAGE
jgi:2-polyprenyl-3-methyl-5-hydroxy-6-metoxy-1,4-benzoquinol methylase